MSATSLMIDAQLMTNGLEINAAPADSAAMRVTNSIFARVIWAGMDLVGTSAPVEISDTTFLHTRVYSLKLRGGAAVARADAAVTVRDSRFTGTSGAEPIPIFDEHNTGGGPMLRVADSSFTDNRGGDSGGIAARECRTAPGVRCVEASRSSFTNGSGQCVSDLVPQISKGFQVENVTFRGRRSMEGDNLP